MLLYFFLFIGQNFAVFSDNETRSWIGIILGIFVLYGLVFDAINILTNLDLCFAGFKLAPLFFGLVIPIGIFGYNYFFKVSELT